MLNTKDILKLKIGVSILLKNHFGILKSYSEYTIELNTRNINIQTSKNIISLSTRLKYLNNNDLLRK